MPSFGYAIYDSNGLIVRASEDFLSLLGINSLEKDADISSLLAAGPKGDDTLLFTPGTVWATPKGAGVKSQHVRLSIESLDRQASSDSPLFLADVEAVEGLEETQSKSDDLDFLKTVSHELRAPLNGIIGFAALLERTNLNEEQAAILRKMQSSNFLLKGLLNDVLEYSRIQSSRIDLSGEKVSIRAFVEELSGLFSERAKAKKLDLEVLANSETDIDVFIPKLRVAQILTNLLSNAIKYTNKGKVTIDCSTMEGGTENRIVFKVEDTGPGIETEDLPRIFQPFSQARGRLNVASEGTGLGLAISRGLAERMGGSLSYQRSVTGGSLFLLELPLTPDDDSIEEAAHDERNASHARIEKRNPLLEDQKRILVVEDNALNADIITHFLRDYGAAFDLVENGREAVSACQENKYDLVLMDIMLPKLNGYEATEAIRGANDSEEKPIVIGVTAKVFRDDQLRCLEVGMKDVIHKPVDFKRLNKVLNKHLFGLEEGDALEPEMIEKSINKADRDPFNKRVAMDYASRMSDSKEGRRVAIDRATESLNELLIQIKESAKTKDLKALERYAHSMKGNAALIGARNVCDLAKGLERIAANDAENLRADHWIALLENSLHEVNRWARNLELED